MTLAEKYRKAITEKPNGRPDWRTDKALIGHGICPYCGRKAKGEVYCAKCRREGFDEVHKMFGGTNGWDRRPIRVTPIRLGWRGTKVSGATNRGKCGIETTERWR